MLSLNLTILGSFRALGPLGYYYSGGLNFCWVCPVVWFFGCVFPSSPILICLFVCCTVLGCSKCVKEGLVEGGDRRVGHLGTSWAA